MFFFNDTATTEIYTLSLHDALPISRPRTSTARSPTARRLHRLHALELVPRVDPRLLVGGQLPRRDVGQDGVDLGRVDRKSTRLNSSHANISYAVFCLKKNNTISHLT